MVTYGPWVEPPVWEERLVLPLALDPDGLTWRRERDAGTAGRSGWGFSFLAPNSTSATPWASQWQGNGLAILNPAASVPIPDPSQEAWAAMEVDELLRENQNRHAGAVTMFEAKHSYDVMAEEYTQRNQWEVLLPEVRLEHYPVSGQVYVYDPSHADAIAIEWEHPAETSADVRPPELVSMTANAYVSNTEFFDLRVKPAGVPSGGWMNWDGDSESGGTNTTTRNNFPGLSSGGAYSFDSAALAAMQANMRGSLSQPNTIPTGTNGVAQRTHFGLAMTGTWPEVYLPGDEGWLSVGDFSLEVVVRFRTQRYRMVYEGDPPPLAVPYRRTSHRHDSLAGGASRNYPPSRALQSSNRIGGGYL